MPLQEPLCVSDPASASGASPPLRALSASQSPLRLSEPVSGASPPLRAWEAAPPANLESRLSGIKAIYGGKEVGQKNAPQPMKPPTVEEKK